MTKMIKYGYIRVSTKEQNVDRQVEAMKDVGIEKNKMFIDKQSGKDFDRKSYKRMLNKLHAGDEVYILDLPLLDTRNKINRLTGKFIADLVLQILSYVAQIERENIRQRQAEGIQLAKQKGVKFGRPLKELPENFDSIYELWEKNLISLREAGRMLEISHTSFLRYAKRYNK